MLVNHIGCVFTLDSIVLREVILHVILVGTGLSYNMTQPEVFFMSD